MMIYLFNLCLFILLIWYYVGMLFSHQQLFAKSLYKRLDICLPIRYCSLACDPNNNDNVITISKNGINYGIYKNGIFIIRSTSNCADISVTFDTDLIHTRDGIFHKGYYKRAKFIYKLITKSDIKRINKER